MPQGYGGVKQTGPCFTALTKSLNAPSPARVHGRCAAGDGGLSIIRHTTHQVSMDFVSAWPLFYARIYVRFQARLLITQSNSGCGRYSAKVATPAR